MKDNPKNMPAIDTGSRFSAHPIATNTQMEGIGLEKRMVSEQIQIKAERMFCGTFFRCSVERTEIVIQPVQFVFAQVRQCFGVTFPGEELGVPDH